MTSPRIPKPVPGQVLHNERVAGALDDVWSRFGSRDSLFPNLALDAVLVRADQGELRAALPRMLELATSPLADPEGAVAVFDRLEAAGWSDWAADERRSIERVLDQWWLTELALEPGEPALHEVLGALARLDIELVRWLDPWLRDLDGPGARHLASMVDDQLSWSRWQETPDRRRQVLAWTRSEPVVMGLTVVGGVHLEPGQLGDALDRML